MKFALINTILFLILTYTKAQPNLYFQNNPVWQILSSCAVPAPCIREESKNYYLNGDTLINSYTYKQVYKKGQGYYYWWTAPPPDCSGSFWYIDTLPAFFIRSSGQQIFLRQLNDTNEYLLFDFDLSVGDTLPVTYNNPQSDIYVSGIDSINTPHGYLKRYALTGNNTAQFLIEGIGSTNGLVEPISVILECGHSLTCYSLNDTAVYPTSGPTCNLNINVTSYNRNINVEFSPNPFSVRTVLISDQHLYNARLTVENCFGQTVAQIENISGENIVISRNELSSGLYIFKLTQDNKIIATNKIIITD